MHTERASLIIGVTPGYGHNNEEAVDQNTALKQATETGITIARQVLAETNIYIDFVAIPGYAGYSHEHGCPEGGEFVVILQGERNDHFCQDAEAFRDAWSRFANLMKEELKQTTARLVFQQAELIYLKD